MQVQIGFFSKRQTKMKWDFSGREKRRPLQKNLKGYYPVAVKYISDLLNCSLDTANRWKKIAKDAGLIDVMPNYIDSGIDTYSEFQFARVVFPDGRRLRKTTMKNGDVDYSWCSIDLIKPIGIKFKTRKKSYENKEITN
jgi:hypothetical protein